MKTRVLLALVALCALIATSCGSDVTVVGEVTNELSESTTDVADAASDAASDAVDAVADDDEDAMADDEAMAEDEDAMADDEAMTEDEDAMAEDEAMADDEDAMADSVRIVSMSPTATEMLFAIDAGDQVVAVDSFSYFPAEAPVTDLSAFEPNVEAIAGFEPDVVFSSFPIEGLDALGIENVVLPAATNLDEIYTQIEQLGARTGNIGEAAEVVSEMRTRIDTAIASVDGIADGITYYHELDNTLYSVTSSTFIGYLYEQFGLTNVADPADEDGSAFGYPQLSEEFLVTADPDIIFLADTLCCEQSAETVAARPGWDQLGAVQNGNIIELNDDIVSRWGPRTAEFAEQIADAIINLSVPVSS